MLSLSTLSPNINFAPIFITQAWKQLDELRRAVDEARRVAAGAKEAELARTHAVRRARSPKAADAQDAASVEASLGDGFTGGGGADLSDAVDETDETIDAAIAEGVMMMSDISLPDTLRRTDEGGAMSK